jgi:SAM-dependent methyltransferase
MNPAHKAAEDPEQTLPSDPLGALRDYWNECAEHFNSGPGKTTPQLMDAMLCDFAGDGPVGQALLDLACGAGLTTASLAQRCAPGGRVVGADLSSVMIDAARSGCSQPDVDFVVAPADALPFADHSFEHVFCNMGLMLFPSPGDALLEIARVLKPGGTLRTSVWGRAEHSTVMYLLRSVAESLGIALPRPPRSNFHLGQPEDLQSLLSATGLSLRSYRYQTLPFVYADGASACEGLGISETLPGPAMRLVDPQDRPRLVSACRDEAERRLQAGGGALVLDALLAVIA